MIPLRLEEVAALVEGRLDAAPKAEQVTGVQVDSRRIAPGDLFVAVGRGADFCDDALERGAAATLVPDEPFAAFAALGSAVRERSSARVVGITGSTGKTSTKDILAALGRAGRANGRHRSELQQRDRRSADPLPARARHGGLHRRARDARFRPDRRSLRDRPTGPGRRDERGARAPRAGGLARRRGAGQERADRSAAARRHGDRSGRVSRSSARTSRSSASASPGRGSRTAEPSSAASASTSRPHTTRPMPPQRSPRSTRSACRDRSGSTSSSRAGAGRMCRWPVAG